MVREASKLSRTNVLAQPRPIGRLRLVRNGRRLIIVYFLIAYGWPLIGNLLLGDRLVTPFRRAPLTAYAVVLVACILFMYALFARGLFKLPRPAARSQKGLSLIGILALAYRRCRLVFALTAFALAVAYYVAGMNSFRYSALPLSEVGTPLLFVTNVVSTIVAVDLFAMMFLRSGSAGRSMKRTAEDVILSLTYLISANGALAVLVGLAALMCSIAPMLFSSLLFSTRTLLSFRTLRRLGMGAVVFLVFFVAGGLTNAGIKAASGGKTDVVESAASAGRNLVSGDLWLSRYLTYVTARTSVYYYSLLFSADDPGDLTAVGKSPPALLPIRNMLFRADLVLGSPFGIERPEVTSMRRLSWLVLAENPAILPRAGTSPGVIAAFNYAVPFPLNMVLCALYLAWLARVVDVVLWRNGSRAVSVFGLMLLFIFWESFLQSPFDILLIVDTTFLYVAMMYGLYRVERERLKAHLHGLMIHGAGPGGRPRVLSDAADFGRYRAARI